jgi:hypothetical protein
LAKILRFYVARGIKFFLFAPTLTLFSSSSSAYCTKIVCGVLVTYANKAAVNTSFLTNIYGDNAIICDNELYRRIKEIDDRLKGERAKELQKITYPDNVVSSALLGKIAKRLTFIIPAEEIRPIKSAGGVAIFGGGVFVKLQSSRRESSRRESSRRDGKGCTGEVDASRAAND